MVSKGRERHAGGGELLGGQHRHASGVGDHAPVPREGAGREFGRAEHPEVVRVVHHRDTERIEQPELQRAPAGDLAGVAGGGLLAGRGAAAEVDDEPLAGRAQFLDRRAEQSAVPDRLHVQRHGVHVRVAREVGHEVRDVHIALVAGADDVGDADARVARPFHHRAADGAALRDDRKVAHGQRLSLGQHRGHAHGQASTHGDQAGAVRPNYVDALLGRVLQQRPLQLQPARPHVTEPSGEDERLTGPDGRTVLQHLTHMAGRDGDDYDIRRARQIPQRTRGGTAFDTVRRRVDHRHLAGVAVDTEMVEDGASTGLVRGTGARRNPDDGHRGGLQKALGNVRSRPGEPC